jgi:phosphoglycerate dehydrogenase-like enzyme
MGRIGSRVARICAAGFGAAVMYNDIVDMTPFPFKTRAVDKAEIWSTADIVTLHLPLTDLTQRLVSADVLRTFRPNALLLNTARGRLVDSGALLDALCDARICGAALDVTDPEPLPLNHPLWNCDNCILTPHVASRTHSGLRNMFSIAGDVLAYLERARDDVPDVDSTGTSSAK